MAIDPSRAAFVKNEYRYAKAEDFSTKAVYENARKISIPSQLSQSAAQALATNLLAKLKLTSEGLEIEIQEYWTLDMFNAALPRIIGNFPEVNVTNRTYDVISYTGDAISQRSTLVVKL